MRHEGTKASEDSRPMHYDPVRDLAVWGASGHALVVADIIRLQARYRIVGFIDDANPSARTYCGSPVLGNRAVLKELYSAGLRHVIIAFGKCTARLECGTLVRSWGFDLPTVIHPDAILADDVQLGPGTVVAAGVIVNPGTRVGSSVILNTGASIDHECCIGDGAHICPGVKLAGNVTVGKAAWLGIGSTVIERVEIGAGAFLGAGSVVVDSIPPGALAYGVPARVVRGEAAMTNAFRYTSMQAAQKNDE